MAHDLLHAYRSSLRAKIFRKLSSAGLDSLLVTDLPTIRWLTGFSGSYAKLLFAGDATAVLFTDFRYQEQVRRETSGIATVILKDALATELASGSFRLGDKMALQADHVTWHEMRQLSEKLGNREFSPVSSFFDEFREIKHVAELDRMRRAVELSESVLEAVIGMIGPGVTEIDLAAEITYGHRKLGAEGDSFEPIVAGGAHGAMPHAKPTAAEFEPGSLIVIDMGCVVDGYASDQTRTVAFGKVSDEQRQVYRIVREAQQLGIDAAKAGMAARDLDAEVRNFIAAAGYGEAFGHGLGHGVGVEVHEAPRVGTASVGALREGAVFTIEPGIYLPGRFGVRIEDMVTLGPDGAEPLQRFTKDLIEL
ncbi:aminopeptidase P family protein [Chlorobaculum sp. 24CR]|uniref:M24 family metallopeptidase n=1 Tax=Chlorobaculum sp. 24CR TaxID=2508878 RepID=UPI00100C165C|nr:aminopeptidase P family protein [Chlorobaculum sp. 24CR]RXK89097.1 aminopeptidase P family protein [Chlorobaculum sp. 24CR]